MIAGSILSSNGNGRLGDIFLGVSSGCGIIALIVLIIRLTLATDSNIVGVNQNTTVKVKIVDVKDIPKTKEQKLYEQYEDLYKQNLITKEDLDKKKEELLGK